MTGVLTADWFKVDRQGLAQIADRNGRAQTALEIIGNAWDQRVTKVSISLVASGRGLATLTVEDDDPEGFRDLSHAYTMYAKTWKRSEAEVRGRWNRGEKLVLSLCETATIASTKGTVSFDASGRTETKTKTTAGTVFTAEIRFRKTDIEEFERLIHQLIPPVTTTYNGIELVRRVPVLSFRATLATEIEDAETGEFRRTARKTEVRLYEPTGVAYLYEMGMPVVETGDRWDVEVLQKVPLNSDRDNVTPAFLRQVRTAVLNDSYRLIAPEDTTTTWVKEALPNASNEALAKILDERYGKERVIFDPSDPEANKIAVSKNICVLPPRAFPKPVWDRIRDAGLALPAGQVTPSNSTVRTSANGKPPIDPGKYTPGMVATAQYAREMAQALIGRSISVSFHLSEQRNWAAAYGDGSLMFNVSVLGYKWFDQGRTITQDELIVHELGHEYGGHLDKTYHDALCSFAAKLHRLNLTNK